MVVPAAAQGAMTDSLLTGFPSLATLQPGDEERIRTTIGVAATTPQYWLLTVPAGYCCGFESQLIAIDPDTDFVLQPWLAQPLSEPLGEDGVLLGAEVAIVWRARLTPTQARNILLMAPQTPDTARFKPGGKALPASRAPYELAQRPFRVVGALAPTGTGLDRSVIVSVAAVRRRLSDPAPLAAPSVVMVRLGVAATPILVQRTIETRVPQARALSRQELATTAARHAAGLVRGLGLVTALTWGLTLVLTLALFAAVGRERRLEVGVLRAMGASRGFILRQTLFEALVVAGIAAVLGVALGLAIFLSFRTAISLYVDLPALHLPAATLGRDALLVLASGGLAAAAGALLAALWNGRVPPAEAVREGA
jgi:putative ABC transport system permease protein